MCGLLVFPKDTGNRNFTDALEGRVLMQGGERLPAAVFCHGTEGADIGFAPKHLEAGHPELDIGIRAGDRIVEVDDAVVGVDDVDRRIGQAVEDVAGGFVTFAQKAGGAALPDVLPDDFGHEDEGVHFLLRPYAAVAALLEADMADHVPVAHDVALEERGDGAVEDERFFFRGDFRKIAAIIDAAGVPCFGTAPWCSISDRSTIHARC